MRPTPLLVIGALAASCSGAPRLAPVAVPSAAADQDRLLIEAAFERWVNAYERGDPDALSRLFTQDAIYAANTGELLIGRAGIRSGSAAWMRGSSRVGQQRARATLDLERRSLRFRQEGAIAYDLARFTISMHPPGCVVDSGHALAVWEKQPDGSWLIDTLTVNQDKAPPPSACARR